MVSELCIHNLASPRPVLQHDSEYIFVTLELHITFIEIFCFGDFLGEMGQEQTGRDTWTDRLFWNILKL